MRASAGSHRTFLYVRVSTYDQAEYGTSLDGRRDLGVKFCAEQGYADPQVRVEVESAGEEKIERRRELRRILGEIRSGDVLVCRDLSRWSRDQVFAVHSVRQMRAKGVKVRFYTQPFLDYVPGATIDLLGIIAWTAENERNATRERTMGNRRRLRANGAFVEGLPPFGYTVEDRRLVIVPEHALIVVRIHIDSANGVAVRKIVDWLRVEYPRVVIGRTKKHVMQWGSAGARAPGRPGARVVGRAVERPATRSEPIPDFKRLAADLDEARMNAVRLAVKGIISEQDAAKQLTELKRDEEALEARRVEYERRQTHDTEEARRAAFAKLTEYRGVWARLLATDRRELLSELAETVLLTASGDIVIEWRPIADVAVSMGGLVVELTPLAPVLSDAA